MNQQLSLFDVPTDQSSLIWHLYVDGASRNNPGPAGAGIVIMKDNKPHVQKGFFVGIKTNNQAEYLALLLGFFLLEPLIQPQDELHIVSDSQLLIRQLRGEYKVREPKLLPLYSCAKAFLSTKNHRLEHVVREKNMLADRLANSGIDKHEKVPAEFDNFCLRYQ